MNVKNCFWLATLWLTIIITTISCNNEEKKHLKKSFLNPVATKNFPNGAFTAKSGRNIVTYKYLTQSIDVYSQDSNFEFEQSILLPDSINSVTSLSFNADVIYFTSNYKNHNGGGLYKIDFNTQKIELVNFNEDYFYGFGYSYEVNKKYYFVGKRSSLKTSSNPVERLKQSNENFTVFCLNVETNELSKLESYNFSDVVDINSMFLSNNGITFFSGFEENELQEKTKEPISFIRIFENELPHAHTVSEAYLRTRLLSNEYGSRFFVKHWMIYSKSYALETAIDENGLNLGFKNKIKSIILKDTINNSTYEYFTKDLFLVPIKGADKLFFSSPDTLYSIDIDYLLRQKN